MWISEEISFRITTQQVSLYWFYDTREVNTGHSNFAHLKRNMWLFRGNMAQAKTTQLERIPCILPS